MHFYNKFRKKISREENFLKKLEELSEKESKEYKEILEKYHQAAVEKLELDKYRKTNKDIEVKYNNLHSKVVNESTDNPATFFLHFYNNGDMKWIWGIDKEDTYMDVAKKSDGGRVADQDDATWNELSFRNKSQ